MSRNQKNAQRKFDTRMSFNEMCRRIGIEPRQRIVIRRYLVKKVSKKGGENL